MCNQREAIITIRLISMSFTDVQFTLLSGSIPLGQRCAMFHSMPCTCAPCLRNSFHNDVEMKALSRCLKFQCVLCFYLEHASTCWVVSLPGCCGEQSCQSSTIGHCSEYGIGVVSTKMYYTEECSSKCNNNYLARDYI